MRATAYHEGRHLAEALLEPPLSECPLCGATTRSPVLAAQTDPLVELLSCRRCRACSVSRMPLPSALDDYYSTYYDNSDAAAVTTDDPARLARRIAAYCERAGHIDMLDFGGGDGSVAVATALAVQTGGGTADITVVDYDQGRKVETPASITRGWEPALDRLGDRKFDVVLASAVLEHLARPVPTLIELLSRLAPGGVLYIRTPFVVPIMRVAHWARVPFDFTFPAHLHDLGQPFWDGLLDWLPARDDGVGVRQIGSRPSPLETSLRVSPTRTIVAAILKAPWKVLGSRYALVGGWEAVYRAERPD
jgi:SAM-dependent methyltransferase